MVQYDIIFSYDGELQRRGFTSNRPSDKEVLTNTYDETVVRENAFKTLNDILVKEQKEPLIDPLTIRCTLTVVNEE